jgi:hypothetical protein
MSHDFCKQGLVCRKYGIDKPFAFRRWAGVICFAMNLSSDTFVGQLK